jgi:LmbE family N-acetylglucosaminyl deacetylase
MARMTRLTVALLDAAHSVLAREPAGVSLRARTLVFAPHQDDEVLGCGGTLLRKIEAGAAVHLVFMTDGSASHRGLMGPLELAALRRDEARAAARVLGVASEQVTFLNLPDDELGRHHGQAVAAVGRVMESFRPEEVLVPHARDRLPDHVATYAAVTEALLSLRQPVRLLEYPIWLWHSWPWAARATRSGGRLSALQDCWALVAGCRIRVDIRPFLERKRAALAAHQSQILRRDGDAAWQVLGDVSGGEWLERFFTGYERFRESRPCG